LLIGSTSSNIVKYANQSVLVVKWIGEYLLTNIKVNEFMIDRHNLLKLF
jgi:hypothetical protein